MNHSRSLLFPSLALVVGHILCMGGIVNTGFAEYL
jgi:hypothetical protein